MQDQATKNTLTLFQLLKRINKTYEPGSPVVKSSNNIIKFEYPGWRMSKRCVGTLHIAIDSTGPSLLIVEQDDDEEYHEAYGMDYTFCHSNNQAHNSSIMLEIYDHLTDLVYWTKKGSDAP